MGKSTILDAFYQNFSDKPTILIAIFLTFPFNKINF